MSDVTAKKIVGLVGHCVPDSSHLTMIVTRAQPGAVVKRVTDEASTQALLAAGVDLLLVNRAMEPGYADSLGTDYIRRLRASHPNVKLMLISNYPESQAEAVKDGALPGFGKAELTKPETLEKLKLALK
jgi:CheY-like chemotaxis protein